MQSQLGGVLFSWLQRFVHDQGTAWYAARRIFAVLGVFAVALLDPLGLQAVSDKRSRDAAYQILAPFYDNSQRDEIALVLIDTPTISSGAMSWPPSFDQYELLLKGIVAGVPRAVFLDLLFLDERGSEWELKEFARTIEETAQALPVFLPSAQEATPPGWHCPSLEEDVLVPLAQAATKITASEVLPFVRYRGFGEYYPAYGYCGKTLLPSPASALYQGGNPEISHEEEAKHMAEPISIIWGDSTAPFNLDFYSPKSTKSGHQAGCVTPPNSTWERLSIAGGRLVRAVFNGWPGESETRPCLYHPHMSASTLIDLFQQASAPGEPKNWASHQLDRFLFGKYVLVGVALPGIGDYGLSPTHGQVPGVAIHAMALDNLLTMGTEYLKEPPRYFLELDEGDFLQITTVIILIMLDIIMFRLFSDFMRGASTVCRLAVEVAMLLAGAVLILGMTAWMVLVLRIEPSNWLALLLAYLGFVSAYAFIRLSNLIKPPISRDITHLCSQER